MARLAFQLELSNIQNGCATQYRSAGRNFMGDGQATRRLAVVGLLAGLLVGAVAAAPHANAMSIVSSPNVTTAGTTVSRLNAVSCVGPASCVAVGSSTSSGVTKTLIEHWNGLAWS